MLYKSLPSLILPAGDDDGRGGRPAREPAVVAAAQWTAVEGPSPAVIPLKETLARRLSASMDCIDVAGTKDPSQKHQTSDVDDVAAAANMTASESQLGADNDEPLQTQRP